MSNAERPPLGIRLLSGLRKEPDWSSMTTPELLKLRDTQNRMATSRLARPITRFPDRGAMIRWQELSLQGCNIKLRVYRPSPARSAGDLQQRDLPLVFHVHGGGFAGTAIQSDWVNSHLAARLPAVVVSVEHRLIAPVVPLSTAVDDGWDALGDVVRDAARWGIDPSRVAVFGESAGALIAALCAIRAREAGMSLRAQILVNTCVDVTSEAFEHPSMTRYADNPTVTRAQLQLFLRLAVPAGSDPRPLSPLHAENPSGLAPALVVVPTFDPLADHGRRYAERLRAAGTPARLSEHRGATHAFLSTPGVVPQAKPARAEIVKFLRAL